MYVPLKEAVVQVAMTRVMSANNYDVRDGLMEGGYGFHACFVGVTHFPD